MSYINRHGQHFVLGMNARVSSLGFLCIFERFKQLSHETHLAFHL